MTTEVMCHTHPPYFEGIETREMDILRVRPDRRVKKATNPDGTYVTKDYLKAGLLM